MYQRFTSDMYRVALGYAPPFARQHYAALFDLEMQLARIVSSTGEPVLRQIKLAWWREQLNDLGERAHADPVLRLLASNWLTETNSLVPIVDGWEALLGHIDQNSMQFCIRRRLEGYQAVARLLNVSAAAAAVADAVRWWLAADLVGWSRADDAMKYCIASLADCWIVSLPRLPPVLRPLSILAALGQRSILRGGNPPLSRRSDALVAARVGLFGR